MSPSPGLCLCWLSPSLRFGAFAPLGQLRTAEAAQPCGIAVPALSLTAHPRLTPALGFGAQAQACIPSVGLWLPLSGLVGLWPPLRYI